MLQWENKWRGKRR